MDSDYPFDIFSLFLVYIISGTMLYYILRTISVRGSRGRCGRDCMVVEFTTTCTISPYHRSWRGILDTTLYDKVCQ